VRQATGSPTEGGAMKHEVWIEEYRHCGCSCKKELSEVLVMRKGFMFVKSALVCPHCHVLIGFGNQNML
jgi:hypothetical protein